MSGIWRCCLLDGLPGSEIVFGYALEYVAETTEAESDYGRVMTGIRRCCLQLRGLEIIIGVCSYLISSAVFFFYQNVF